MFDHWPGRGPALSQQLDYSTVYNSPQKSLDLYRDYSEVFDILDFLVDGISNTWDVQ